MIKRLYILLIMFFGIVTTSHAVLKEDSIANTLSLLRQELVKYHDEFSTRNNQTSRFAIILFDVVT
mgnify:CR=1 FL=1